VYVSNDAREKRRPVEDAGRGRMGKGPRWRMREGTSCWCLGRSSSEKRGYALLEEVPGNAKEA
jgi:hypothetical protein